MFGMCTFVVSLMAIYTHGEVTRIFGINLYYGMYIVLFASLCTIWISFLGMCGMSAKNRFFVFIVSYTTLHPTLCKYDISRIFVLFYLNVLFMTFQIFHFYFLKETSV